MVHHDAGKRPILFQIWRERNVYCDWKIDQNVEWNPTIAICYCNNSW